MNKLIFFIGISFIIGCNADNHNKSISIAFGSCSRQDIDRQMWPEIIADQPDLFVWTGDIVYADHMSLSEMQSAYDRQKNHPDYQKLLAQIPVIGVWDDHDYGVNDGGKYYPYKEETQKILLDFLDVPEMDARRQKAGVYFTHTFTKHEKQIKIIMLDTRYFRDTLAADTLTEARYLVNTTGDILGESQWQWLENELADSSADATIVVSSIQIIPEQHPYEKWANFPAARKRLFDLFVKTQPKNLVLVSGDRHIAEISKINVVNYPAPIYEFTASGLTHSWETIQEEPNEYRIGSLVASKNYGLINFNWNGQDLQVSLISKGYQDEIFLTQNIDFYP